MLTVPDDEESSRGGASLTAGVNAFGGGGGFGTKAVVAIGPTAANPDFGLSGSLGRDAFVVLLMRFCGAVPEANGCDLRAGTAFGGALTTVGSLGTTRIAGSAGVGAAFTGTGLASDAATDPLAGFGNRNSGVTALAAAAISSCL